MRERQRPDGGAVPTALGPNGPDGAAASGIPSDRPDQARRRLVRGAAAVAPVILTLRSGSVLAGVSCTGVMVVGEDTTVPPGQCGITFEVDLSCPPGKVPTSMPNITGIFGPGAQLPAGGAIVSANALTSLGLSCLTPAG